MMGWLGKTVSALALVVALGSVGHASTPLKEAPRELDKVFASAVENSGGDFEAFLVKVIEDFAKAAGKTLIVGQSGSSPATGETLARAFLAADRNADAKLTQTEINNASLTRAFADVFADADGDGSIDLKELYAAVERFNSSEKAALLKPYIRRGGASVEAVFASASQFFRRLDQDRNGHLDEREMRRMHAMTNGMPMPSTPRVVPAECSMSSPSEKAELVLFSVYEGEAMSTVYIGNPDVETSAIRINIKPGDRPLHLVVSSYESMVWKFEGDVSRLEKVVVAEPIGGRHSGVVGVGRDKVEFLNGGRDCLRNFHEPQSVDGLRARTAVQAMAGRNPDELSGRYGVFKVSLPSAQYEDVGRGRVRAPAGMPTREWDAATHFSPAGLLDVEPESVVSQVSVGKYDVLPQGFGIAQLVASGHLEPMRGAYRIVKPIPRFPAGLNGAHSVSFVLAEGVKMPEGSSGHSCVVREDNGHSSGPCF